MDVEAWLDKAWRGETLTEREVKALCMKLKLKLMEDSNVLPLSSPVAIVGDVHAQFHDVLEVFRVAGPVPRTNYVFLGNYVNHSEFGLETITLLACLKLKYPERVHLLRGNHDSRTMSRLYGFYDECLIKHGTPVVWREFTELFDHLPLSALVDNSVLCVHGGLSPRVTTLDQIRVLPRFAEIPAQGAIADLLWSDPHNEVHHHQKSGRGTGCIFGFDKVLEFTDRNKLSKIVRGNQLVMEGYQNLFKNRVVTVWSAPNFAGNMGNVGCVMELFDAKQTHRFNVFGPAPVQERGAGGADGVPMSVKAQRYFA